MVYFVRREDCEVEPRLSLRRGFMVYFVRREDCGVEPQLRGDCSRAS